jgi:hypothetical protein
VSAVKYREHVRHRALHPERHPVDPLRTKLGQRSLVHRFRVRFRRDLDIAREPEVGPDGGQDLPKISRW